MELNPVFHVISWKSLMHLEQCTAHKLKYSYLLQY
jgi:hypothetical protein